MAHRYNKWSDYVPLPQSQQDQILTELIQKMGAKNWTLISRKMKTNYQINKRNGKQCRERWYNHLLKTITKQEWNQDEERKLIQLQAALGNRWMDIAQQFKGRSDNHIKNHFYSIIRKSLRKMCKFVDVKTTSLNIYSVKPYTISQIFYLGGAGEGRSERQVSQRVLKGVGGRLNLKECAEITHLIIAFIFDSNITEPISEQLNTNIKWALNTMIEINEFYQKENGSDVSPQSYSEQDSSLEKSQKIGKMEEEMNRLCIGKHEGENQLKKEEQGDSCEEEGGIFSVKPKTRHQHRQNHTTPTLSMIQSANLLDNIKPIISQPLIQLKPTLLRRSSDFPSSDFDIQQMMQMNEQQEYTLQLLYYKTPKKSNGDIFSRELRE